MSAPSKPVPDGYVPPMRSSFDALVSIHGLTSNTQPDGFTVSIKDSDSGATMTATLSLEAFARCIGGQGYVVAEGVARRLPLMGAQCEKKTERVPWERGEWHPKEAPRTSEEAAALAPFEIDGWRGRVSDLRNHHRNNRDGTYTVAFFRDVLKGESR